MVIMWSGGHPEVGVHKEGRDFIQGSGCHPGVGVHQECWEFIGGWGREFIQEVRGLSRGREFIQEVRGLSRGREVIQEVGISWGGVIIKLKKMLKLYSYPNPPYMVGIALTKSSIFVFFSYKSAI